MLPQLDLFGETLGNTEHRIDPDLTLARVVSVKKKHEEVEDYCLHSKVRPYELIRISSTIVRLLHK
jgi:hypothetical protein